MQPPSLSSSIQTVTVHRFGAQVTRSSTILRLDGDFPDAVRIAGLPLSLEDTSVRVRMLADGAGLATPIATGFHVGLEVPEAVTGESGDPEIEQARFELLRLTSISERLAAEIKLLQEMRSPVRPGGSPGAPPPPSPADSRLHLLAFRREELDRRGEQLRRVRVAIARATERRHDLLQQRSNGSSARPQRESELRKSIQIQIDGARAGAELARLELDYFVPGARWVPAYSLDLDRSGTHGQLNIRALIAQVTGEDWSKVELRLSTADALSWSELPDLASLRLGQRPGGGTGAAAGDPGWR